MEKIAKKEDSIDEALRLWRELCEYEKKNGINIPSFGTMNDLGKRNKKKNSIGKILPENVKL